VLIENIKYRLELLHKAHETNSKVPIELVEASGSGIDPHISPIAAYYQIHRVAKARALPDQAVQKLVDEHIEKRQFWILGEPRVNVLKLNLALDDIETIGK
jgi:K+-transporting ATPase ATPase C chain